MIYISFQFGKKLCNYSTIAPLDNYTNVYVRIFYIKKYFNYLKIHLKVIGYFIILII